MDAPAVAMCDAVSLDPVVDAGAAACFTCQAANCMSEIATCSTDCTCAPNYACLERNSTSTLSSGFSTCTEAIDAIMNGNTALTDLNNCATTKCNAECNGGGDGG